MGICSLSLILLADSPGLISHASPVSKAEEEKKQAETGYEAAGQEIQGLEQGRENAASEAEGLGEEMTALLVDVSLLEADMDALRKQIETADQEYNEARAKQEHQYEVMKKRIQFLYEEGEITYLDILLKAKSIGDFVRETEYTRQLYQYDRNMILDYEDVRQEVLARKESLEEQQSEMETMKMEYLARKEGLEQSIETKKAEISNFETRLAHTRARADEYAKLIQQKTEQIRQLKADEEKEPQRQMWEARRQYEQSHVSAAVRDSNTTGPTPTKSSGGTAFGRSVADYALQFVGNPYVWGGTSLTKGADCSGFTQSVYRHFGVPIPRTSAEQANFGEEIAYEDMEPGDLICYAGHVSMYIGNGQIVHAASAKAGITVSGDPAYRTIVAIRRPW